MVWFFRGMFWSAAVVLTVALAWSWLSGAATYAQDDDAGDVPTIEDEPFVYWKCWRTGTHVGYGFTNNQQVELVGGTWTTPYLPDLSALRDAGYLVANSGTGGGRWQQTRASLMDGRFYRSPALRDGSFQPVKPSASYGYFPFVGDGGIYKASGGFQVEDPRTDLTDAEREERNRSPLPDWNPYVAVADRRIDKIEITWDTHSGSAGAGSIDEVARSQKEQVADTETAGHLAYRQGPYRGPASVNSGTLDHYSDGQRIEQSGVGASFGGVPGRVRYCRVAGDGGQRDVLHLHQGRYGVYDLQHQLPAPECDERGFGNQPELAAASGSQYGAGDGPRGGVGTQADWTYRVL